MVAHAFSETRKYRNVRTDGFKDIGCAGGAELEGRTARNGCATKTKKDAGLLDIYRRDPPENGGKPGATGNAAENKDGDIPSGWG